MSGGGIITCLVLLSCAMSAWNTFTSVWYHCYWYFDMHHHASVIMIQQYDGRLVSLSFIMAEANSEINLGKPTLQSRRLPFCNF